MENTEGRIQEAGKGVVVVEIIGPVHEIIQAIWLGQVIGVLLCSLLYFFV